VFEPASHQGQKEAQILSRLAIARGHLSGVERMAQEGSPGPQVIHQLRAVRGALRRIEEMLMEEHLRRCLNCGAQGVLEEILQLWDYSPTPRTEPHKLKGESP
jgi:CsoR family transcriptional regulator, copper-sensing transcriptional repressor